MNVLNRRWLSWVVVGLLGALLAIQLVPYGRDHSDPLLSGLFATRLGIRHQRADDLHASRRQIDHKHG